MFVTAELLYGTQGKRERKEDDRVSVIFHNLRCEGRGYRMCIENLKNGGGR
jgi:hypothetical protein